MKPPHACYYLFNKVFGYPAPADRGEARAELTARRATPYQCLKTQGALGPDGEIIGEDCCGPDRPCYRPEVDFRP